MAVGSADVHLFSSSNAVPGDVLVVTKPFGIAVAAMTHKWRTVLPDPERARKISLVFSERDADCLFAVTKFYLSQSNQKALSLLASKYHPHALKLIQKLGLLGHAEELLLSQCEQLDIHISNYPVLIGMRRICHANEDVLGGFLEGRFAEVNGGLLIAMCRDEAVRFCRELEMLTGMPAWIVGFAKRKAGEVSMAKFTNDPEFMEVGYDLENLKVCMIESKR